MLRVKNCEKLSKVVGQNTVSRVYFRSLKKGVVLPLAIVKKGVELRLEHVINH